MAEVLFLIIFIGKTLRFTNMKIALYGIGGTYNFGCDAIVRGTENMIHSSRPDAML